MCIRDRTAAAYTNVILQGGLRLITLSNRGGGYSENPTVAISSAPTTNNIVPYQTGIATVRTIGGIAYCNKNVSSNLVSIQSVPITNPGAGYTAGPGIRFFGGGSDGAGAAATSFTGDGTLGVVTFTNHGGGFTTNPTVTISGPTGVGKTTTAAKIASEQLLRYKRRVAMITIDTFRIAAVEQLRTYAKIINVPLSIVADKADLDRAIASYSDFDVIIIDTGGCSQRDESQMFELRELFDERGRLHNVLVLSSTTKDSDLNEITRRFGVVPIDSVIFTKLDESSSYGSIFNHSIRFKKPISFLTTGQKVPEDIEVATKERLVDLMLNISGN